jgi:hypothetical protein
MVGFAVGSVVQENPVAAYFTEFLYSMQHFVLSLFVFHA